MRRARAVSSLLSVLAVGFTPLHHDAFVLVPAGRGGITRDASRMMAMPSTRRWQGQRVRRTELSTRAVLDGKQKEKEEDEEDEEEEESGTGKDKETNTLGQDAGVLAATGASGALVGWFLAHTLNMNLDLLGAATGCVAAVGMLAQEGPVGKAATTVGEFALAAFNVAGVALASSDVPNKVAGTVGAEILEVVELTSSAVTKGYLDSLPEPYIALQKEVKAAQEQVADLKVQLDNVTGALAEAQQQLRARAENKSLVDSAKATAAKLAEAKSALAEKDAEIAESLRLARREKETFDRELKAAKEQTARFRGMVESRDDLDGSFKALAEASATLEARVEEYEERLRTLTSENDSIRADYSAEVESMKSERASMRERISDLEASLSSAESRLDEERASLEEELTTMADALEARSSEAEEAAKRAVQLQEAVDKATAEKSAVIEAAKKDSQEAKQSAAAAAKATQEQAALLEEKSALAKQAALATERAEAAEKAAATARAKAAENAAAAEKILVAEKVRAAALEAEAAERAAEADRALAAQERARASRMAMEGKQDRRSHKATRSAKQSYAQGLVEKDAAGDFTRGEEAWDAANASAREEQQRRAERWGGETKLAPEADILGDMDAAREAEKADEEAAPAKEAEIEAGTEQIERSKLKPPTRKAAPRDITSEKGLKMLTVKDLRERCKLSGLPATGKKAELVERLLANLVSA